MTYIYELFKNENLEGLEAELFNVEKVIEGLTKELMFAITESSKQKILKSIEHEEKVKRRIISYIEELRKKTNENMINIL